MNFDQARFNMIAQQIRPWNLADAKVLELLLVVRREQFVPPAWRNLAFADIEVPLGHGAAMMSPKIEAHALQALQLKKHENVLEIGTGSGHMAALLAAHAAHVWSVEIVPELAAAATANLQRQGVANATVATGDGMAGLPAHAPYDVVMISGGLPSVPPALLAQIKVGGRLFAVVGTMPAMTAQLIVREAEDVYRSVGLFETQAQLLQNAAPPRFVF